MHAARRDKLRRLLKKANLESLLVTNGSNVTYLTGFTGDDSFLLITPWEEVLISDFRYITQLEEECPGLRMDIRRAGGPTIAEQTASVVTKSKLAKLGIEAQTMTVALKEKLAELLKGVQIAGTSGTVEELRQIKDAQEVAATRRAVSLAERAFAALRPALRSDQTERQVAAELEYQIRLLGGKGSAFEPIVAVGARAALPHARSTDKRLGDDGFLLIDWGANEGLYRSDLTRVLVRNRIPPKLERVYGVVFEAQQAAIDAVRPGATCEDVDAAARTVITKAGFGENFGHGCGHGVGLDIHESPRLAPKQKQPLRAGMIITIEPGIYLPGQLGVRIEDDVLVTRGGCEVLTSVPKAWDEVFVP